MGRARYRNGDEIDLQECGCDGCEPARINGVLCHEAGCPEAWRDHPVDCFECGYDFYPKSSRQTTCDDCARACEEDEEQEDEE